MLTRAVCERLGCSLTELNRWATTGRLPPDGEVWVYGGPKNQWVRAWLIVTVDAALASVNAWREQDKIMKSFNRRGLRVASC